MSQGSLLVHSEYGICKFNNIKKINLDDFIHDCLELEFADNQKLLLPVENINYITKYGNEDENNINLDKLGTSSWQKRKSQAKKKIKDAATKLIKIASIRDMDIIFDSFIVINSFGISDLIFKIIDGSNKNHL